MLLTSCFGLPLRTGAGIISIVNSILSIVYVLYNVWEYNVNYGYDKREFNDVGFYSSEIEDIFLNYIALVFMLVGFTSLYANLSLKQATIKNEIHKIYLWLLIEYVQLGTFITIETVIGYKYTLTALQLIGLVVCSIIINGIMGYQLLVVQSFYAEEKLVQETNYTKLCSELQSQVQDQDEEFQSVAL